MLAAHPSKVVLANPAIRLKIQHTMGTGDRSGECMDCFLISDRIASILFGLIVFIQKFHRS